MISPNAPYFQDRLKAAMKRIAFLIQAFLKEDSIVKMDLDNFLLQLIYTEVEDFGVQLPSGYLT